MTQLGVQICKTSFYGFSTKKDICKSKKHIGDTELIEKKWERQNLLVIMSSNGENGRHWPWAHLGHSQYSVQKTMKEERLH